jgi:hypothetical protein
MYVVSVSNGFEGMILKCIDVEGDIREDLE